MVNIFVSGVPDELNKRLIRRLNMKKSTGIQKGDKSVAVIEAIRFWLDHGSGEQK